jgi:hypothetical protein
MSSLAVGTAFASRCTPNTNRMKHGRKLSTEEHLGGECLQHDVMESETWVNQERYSGGDGFSARC